MDPKKSNEFIFNKITTGRLSLALFPINSVHRHNQGMKKLIWPNKQHMALIISFMIKVDINLLQTGLTTRDMSNENQMKELFGQNKQQEI